MTQTELNGTLRRLLEHRFGPDWFERYRAVRDAWRALGLPRFDDGPSDGIVTAMAFLVAAVDVAEQLAAGNTPHEAMKALGMGDGLVDAVGTLH